MGSAAKIRETDLYAPIKTLLEGQGYEVKGEVGAADLMAVRGEEPPVIVELKTGFSLTLFHQACERLALTPHVYVAVPHGAGRRFYKSTIANRKLCRRLAIGLMTVRLKDGFVQVHCDPKPPRPVSASKRTIARKALLLQEFSRRMGDPNRGGSAKATLMTAYRQDALRCLLVVRDHGALKASLIASLSGVDRARQIMADNHYGWFARTQRGIYGPGLGAGKALVEHGAELERLRATLPMEAEGPLPDRHEQSGTISA
ncbi:MAG: DUF2161 family putative PD-(D/E)XK-type phosphodiesterase [Pseudomonadota bacterium]